jgi:hypothetical protein
MGEALTIEVGHGQGYAIVTVTGEIDIATVTQLRERLFELAASGPPADSRPGPGRVHRLGRAQCAGRRSQARRRLRRQPAGDLRPAEDPPAAPADRAGPPDTAGPHPGRGAGGPGGGPDRKSASKPLRVIPDRRPRSRGERTTRPCGPGEEAPPPGPQPVLSHGTGHGTIRASAHAARDGSPSNALLAWLARPGR